MPETRGDRSIRNIPIPPGHHHRRGTETPSTYEEDFSEQPQRRRRRGRRGGRRRVFWLALGVFVVIAVVIGVLLSTVFAGASITVAQKTAQVNAPATIDATLNPAAGQLGYQVISTSRTASTSVAASGSEHVSRAAAGLITVYNDYSAKSQELITQTRFETPDGKIYRIHQAITVPGATKKSDGSIAPGHITVMAYADQPGADYNIGSTRFTIPGFKGTARYTGFYATTDGIGGGFVGTQPAVASSTLATAQAALKQGLQNALKTAAATDLPGSMLSIPNTLQITYNSLVETPNPDGSVTLSQSATATADVVRAGDLAAALARQGVPGYSGAAVGFADPSQIAVALAQGSTPGQGTLTLALQGTPTVVWQFDASTLKAALAGKPKSQFESILQSFGPAIDCTSATPCSASIRPFWFSTFPTDPAKIAVHAVPAK